MIAQTPLQPYTWFREHSVAKKTSDDTYYCAITPKWGGSYTNSGQLTTGESFVRDTRLPQGNFVDAMEYWSYKEDFSYPTGQFQRVETLASINTNPDTVHRNVCDGAEQRQKDTYVFPAGSVRLPLAPPPFPVFSESEKHYVRKVAETKAVNRLRRGVASLPMIWFERAETLRNARDRLGNIVDIAVKRQQADLAGYRKIKGKNARKRFARKVANDHLEMIFGWAPLLQDIEGLVEYINEPARDFVRANGTMSISRDAPNVVSRHVGHTDQPDFVAVQKTKEHLGYRCALRADVTSALFNNFQQVGFSPVYTLYDSVPLSFVLGWFSNFGSWIGTFDPLIGVEFRTGSVNERIITRTEVECWGLERPSKPGMTHSDITSGSMKQEVTRTRNTRSVLLAEPEREFFFQNNLSIYSVLASLSLVVQKKLKIAQPVFKHSPFKYKGRKKTPYLPPIKYTKV